MSCEYRNNKTSIGLVEIICSTILVGELLMFYRGPGFFAVVRFGSFSLSSPLLLVSKLDRRHTERLRKRDNLLLGEGGGGKEHMPSESLVLYNAYISLNTLCSYPSALLMSSTFLRKKTHGYWQRNWTIMTQMCLTLFYVPCFTARSSLTLLISLRCALFWLELVVLFCLFSLYQFSLGTRKLE